MEEIEKSIQRYLVDLDTADRQEDERARSQSGRLQDKISALKAQIKQLQAIEAELNESPDGQLSQTDPDARAMKSRGTGIVGYNVQTAVDTKHHLIVAHEVTNIGIDRNQLTPMAEQARTAIGQTDLTVIADRGYYKSEQIRACQEAGITAIVPKTTTSGARAEGRFDKSDFIYDAEANEYRCPAGPEGAACFPRYANRLFSRPTCPKRTPQRSPR
jgi:transposase